MGLGSSKKIKIFSENPRESENATDSAKKWLLCQTFEDLPADGRKAIIKYAEDNENLNNMRRLEFWFESQGVGQLKDFLSPYLIGETHLPASDLNEIDIGSKNLLTRAEDIDYAIRKMKDSMRDELNTFFKEFIEFLKEKDKGS